MINILIVEDQTILRDSLERLINEQKDMTVVGETSDASKAPELCRELSPDLVLMDVVTENDANGLVWAERIRKEFPKIKIVMMTGLPEITCIDKARKAGVHSFIYKNSGYEQLLFVIRNTMKGFGTYPGPEDNQPFVSQFTEKEIAVIRLVCQGKSRSEMIKILGISESTIKPIITSILDKTGFDSIMKFAIYAVGRGLILPDM